jgi:hypothetical protein
MASSLRNVNPRLSDGTFYVCEYNGFRFDPAATETLAVSCRPIPDEAKRTIKYVEVNLTLRTEIYISEFDFDENNVALPSTDLDMDDAIRRLSSQGGSLNYQGKGFGSLNINTSGNDGNIKNTGQWDVAWGPTPLSVDCKPIADNCAWELTWSVRVCIPECDLAQYQNTIMSFNYDVDYSTDYGGYTTRTIRGFIEIPLTRQSQGNRQITTTADDYRQQIICQVPSGFRDAGGGSYTLSSDRRRLDFQFVHSQLPGIVPPKGVVKCSMAMRTQNFAQMNFFRWLFTVEATYEMAAGQFQKAAAVHFRRVIADRVIRIQKVLDKQGAVAPKGPGIPGQAAMDLAGALTGINQGAGILPVNPGVPGQAALDLAMSLTNIAKLATNAATLIGSGASAVGVKGKDAVFADDEATLNAAIPNTSTVFPIFYSAEDPDAYGVPMAKFSCTLVVTPTHPQFFNAGLWEPIKDTPTWDQWRTSLGKIWDPRGIANMGYDPTDDLIIDLCRNTEEVVTQTGNGEQRLGRNDNGALVGAAGVAAGNSAIVKAVVDGWLGEFKRVVDNQGGEGMAVVPNTGEYVEYVNNITYSQIDDTIPVKKLPTDSALDNQYVSTNQPTVDSRFFTDPGNKFNVASGGKTLESQTKFMSRVAPDYSVTIEGYAISIGRVPSSPELVSLSGVPCVPLSRTSKTQVVGNVFVPVYKTSWVKTYAMPQHQGTVIDPSSLDAQGGSSLNSAGGVGSSTLKNVGA